MLSKIFSSQGQYEGFFNYQGKQISERFTLIVRKKPGIPLFEIGNDKNSAKISMFGYGENNEMGNSYARGNSSYIGEYYYKVPQQKYFILYLFCS